jgi:hypothetical protein
MSSGVETSLTIRERSEDRQSDSKRFDSRSPEALALSPNGNAVHPAASPHAVFSTSVGMTENVDPGDVLRSKLWLNSTQPVSRAGEIPAYPQTKCLCYICSFC